MPDTWYRGERLLGLVRMHESDSQNQFKTGHYYPYFKRAGDNAIILFDSTGDTRNAAFYDHEIVPTPNGFVLCNKSGDNSWIKPGKWYPIIHSYFSHKKNNSYLYLSTQHQPKNFRTPTAYPVSLFTIYKPSKEAEPMPSHCDCTVSRSAVIISEPPPPVVQLTAKDLQPGEYGLIIDVTHGIAQNRKGCVVMRTKEADMLVVFMPDGPMTPRVQDGADKGYIIRKLAPGTKLEVTV